MIKKRNEKNCNKMMLILANFTGDSSEKVYTSVDNFSYEQNCKKWTHSIKNIKGKKFIS